MTKLTECRFCGDKLPEGRYNICDKEEYIGKFIDQQLERHSIIYDRLAEI